MARIIRSHRKRVKDAKALIEADPLYRTMDIRFPNTEAFVEVLLLEDIMKMIEKQLKAEQNSRPTTKLGKQAREINIVKYKALHELFKNLIELSRSAIISQKFSLVYRSIPETQLTRAARSVRKLDRLKELALNVHSALAADSNLAVSTARDLDRQADAAESLRRNQELVDQARYGGPDQYSSDKLEEVLPEEEEERTTDNEINSRLITK